MYYSYCSLVGTVTQYHCAKVVSLQLILKINIHVYQKYENELKSYGD